MSFQEPKNWRPWHDIRASIETELRVARTLARALTGWGLGRQHADAPRVPGRTAVTPELAAIGAPKTGPAHAHGNSHQFRVFTQTTVFVGTCRRNLI